MASAKVLFVEDIGMPCLLASRVAVVVVRGGAFSQQ
jgi:hypothetical protein